MKLMNAIVCMSIVMLCVSEAVAGSFRDPRDGKTYKTVKMPDGETWMAENLNYNMNGSVCYDNDASNCSKYGRLYTWEDAQEACPSGWHLPSINEFKTMLNAVGDNASKKLRDRSWKVEKKFCVQYACSYGYGSTIKECRGRGQCNCGQGESICMEYEIRGEGGDGLFSALPAGYYLGYGRKFYDLGEKAPFWSSTERSSSSAYFWIVNDNYAGEGFGSYSKTNGYSVRCLQD